MQLSVGAEIVPVKPASQRQSDACVDSTEAVLELSGHFVHVAAPAASEYAPTSHDSHLSPSLPIVPLKPGWQTQSVIVFDPASAVSEF